MDLVDQQRFLVTTDGGCNAGDGYGGLGGLCTMKHRIQLTTDEHRELNPVFEHPKRLPLYLPYLNL